MISAWWLLLAVFVGVVFGVLVVAMLSANRDD